MKNKFIYISAILLILTLTKCSQFEPLDENLLGEERINYDPAFAEGLLMNAYEGLVNQFSFNDAATDNSVYNVKSDFSRMAEGEWNAQNAYTSRWNHYENILYINKFISVIENVQWNQDVDLNDLFKQRMYGEALALRALRHYWILEEHAGIGTSGNLLGIPYMTEFLDTDADFNIPRLGFEETVNAINQDFEEALLYLPMDYNADINDSPDRYQDYDSTSYAYMFGEQMDQRISGRIVKAFQAKLFLLAASPAYLDGANTYYEKSAAILAELLNENGGVAGVERTGFYDFYYFNPERRKWPEVIWRGTVSPYMTWIEKNNFPPSLNGGGQINPTQDLVEAFPMEDGYPFSTDHQDYSASEPFEYRDPRLQTYILYHGNDLDGEMLNMTPGSGLDELNKVPGKSTRTGYYLKKLLDPGLTISNDGSMTESMKISVFLRYTDLYLMFAEAANEIGGPDYEVDGLSARTIIRAIRSRAGVGVSSGDAYLQSLGSKEDMREMIRNERRIELCFEGQRLYDLRRWELLDDLQDVHGASFDGSRYTSFVVESRNYPSHSNYAPIPYNEVVKFSALEQNAGW